jgi:hypothetical protein
MSLCENGKRKYTRGWDGAKYVKRQTSRKARRNVRAAIRDNDGEVLQANTKGWVW